MVKIKTHKPLEIKQLEHTDLAAMKALQPPDWTDISDSVLFYLNSEYCFPLKLVLDGQVAGIGTTIFLEDTVWLAHIIVHPDHRNKGLGRGITQALIDSVDRKKYKTICLIATDLGAAVYRKLGFVSETSYSFFKEGTREYEIHPNIIPYTEIIKADLLALDREASGEDRSRFLLEHMQGALVFMDSNKLEGFYLPAIRDGLIIAQNANAGLELMKRRLKDLPFAILPDTNTAAITFLKENGFIEFRKAKRMRLGEEREWRPEYYFNRISGQLG